MVVNTINIYFNKTDTMRLENFEKILIFTGYTHTGAHTRHMGVVFVVFCFVTQSVH